MTIVGVGVIVDPLVFLRDRSHAGTKMLRAFACSCFLTAGTCSSREFVRYVCLQDRSHVTGKGMRETSGSRMRAVDAKLID
jgi:hypothetical protein